MNVKLRAVAEKQVFGTRTRFAVIAVVSLVMKMVMGCCSNLTSLVIVVHCKRLSKAHASLTMSHFIITQKAIAGPVSECGINLSHNVALLMILC